MNHKLKVVVAGVFVLAMNMGAEGSCAEPGAKPGPHDCTEKTACANPTKSSEERRYKLTVTGHSNKGGKYELENIFINHNARGAWLNEDIKRRLPEVTWTDTVRASRQSRWELKVRASVTPKRELLMQCKIEVLGGPDDGDIIDMQAAGSGGVIVCYKPVGR